MTFNNTDSLSLDTLSKEQSQPSEQSKEQQQQQQQTQTQAQTQTQVEENKVDDESAKTRKRDPQIEEIDRKVKRLREYYDIKYKIGEGMFMHSLLDTIFIDHLGNRHFQYCL